MDLRTRWTLIGGAGAAALCAAAALPPRACSPDARSLAAALVCSDQWQGWWGSARAQSRVVTRTERGLGSALQRRVLADSLLLLSRGPRVLRSPSGITVVFEAPLTADSARRWLERAEREVTQMPPGGPGAEVVVHLTATSSATMVTRKLRGDTASVMYQVPVRFAAVGRDGVARCFTRMDVAGRQRDAGLRGGVLDWCALYARYGVPGPGVAQWAGGVFGWRWRWGGSFADEIAAAARSTYRRTEDGYLWRACAEGADLPCRVLIGDVEFERALWPVLERRRAFLAWVVATEGGERFGRFWRGSGGLDEAMTTAFGRPARNTVQRWVLATVRDPEQSAGEHPRVLLAGALWMSLALTAAFVAMQRRQVD